MENWLLESINDFGYFGILFLIALENVFPPIPSEVILTFAGFMTVSSKLTITGVVIASTFGSVLGALILYAIGTKLNINRLEKIIDKWGHLFRLTKEDIYKADKWFNKYGPWTVFFCRFIPLIRSLISVPAGMSKMNIGLFFLLTTIGTFIWNIALITLGASVGSSWEDIVGIMDIYSKIAYVLLFLGFIIFVLFFIKKKNKKKHT